MVFDYEGRKYELSYTEEVIETVEKITGHSVMASIFEHNAMLPLTDLKCLFIYGLMEVGGDRVKFNKGQQIYKDMLNEKGYTDCVGIVLEALQKDLPFFFQVN